MRFSFWISSDKPWAEVLDLATHAEATGWDGLWLADHFMPNDDNALDQPTGECFSLLAGLAAAVPRVRWGRSSPANTYRHPAVLTKQAASIDDISGGRFVLGVGAGWQENEHARYGIPLGTISERVAWFEEACQVFTGLRDHARTTVEGERYQLHDAPLVPKPTGPMPLLIGSSGQQKMAAIVARYADEWNTWSTPSLWLEKRVGYDRALDEIDRDPGVAATAPPRPSCSWPGRQGQGRRAGCDPAGGRRHQRAVDRDDRWRGPRPASTSSSCRASPSVRSSAPRTRSISSSPRSRPRSGERERPAHRPFEGGREQPAALGVQVAAVHVDEVVASRRAALGGAAQDRGRIEGDDVGMASGDALLDREQPHRVGDRRLGG